MFNFQNRSPRRHPRLQLESLEARNLLAVGPFLHTHNGSQLAVVDAASGDLQVIHQLNGFAPGDAVLQDIAFGPTGRLFGITQEWLYEVHPASGQLTPLGQHEVPRATSLVVGGDGALRVMGFDSPELKRILVNETSIVSSNTQATLSSLGDGGSNGDIAYMNQDLVVASTDNRLLWYRFDVSPSRPRVVRELDLDPLGVNNVYGLAVVDGTLYATTNDAVLRFDLSDSTRPLVIEEPVDDATFGSLRGAAYYAETGGPIPAGTLSGVKWNDVNGDGLQQISEPLLTDWAVYLDANLDGVFNLGEPLRRTDAEGRYYFFGLAPGFYTVDEIIPNANDWEQTYPLSPQRNLIGLYDFEDNTVQNQLAHDYGLPDLVAALVSVSDGAASWTSSSAFLELPTPLGAQPFTIAIDAQYNPTFTTDQFLVSQRSGPNPVDQDFRLSANGVMKTLSSTFCNAAGNCPAVTLGSVDGERHQMAITWNNGVVGNFFDDQLETRSVTGTLPDLDGQVVRFGNPTASLTGSGLRGTVYEIRIFSGALSAAQLRESFNATLRPSAYTVVLGDEFAIGDLDFGNREPVIVEMIPEIDVRLGSVSGDPIVDDGDPLDLGRATVDEPAPSAVIVVRNVGNATLTLPTITVSAGFEIQGTHASNLGPNESTSFTVVVSDLTPGIKSGEVTIANNDPDENPFTIPLLAEILAVDARPRELLINTTNGNVIRIDPTTGNLTTLATGLRSMTDMAHHPTTDRLYGIDAVQLYEIDLDAGTTRTLFAHGVRNAAALGFSPTGELFIAGQDVYRVNLDNRTTQFYAAGGSALAGDLAFVGSRMYLSTTNGDLYEIRSTGPARLGNLSGVAINGLASTDADTLYGFSDNRAYLIGLNDLSLTPQFSLFIFTIAGATYLPTIDAHNADEPTDVDGSGAVVPLDALLIINELNDPQFSDPVDGRIVITPTPPTRYPDVNQDGYITPIDALLVINRLNEEAAAAARATAASWATFDAEGELPGDWDARLLSDLAWSLAASDRERKA